MTKRPKSPDDPTIAELDDDALWRSVTQSVQPLARRGLLPDSAKQGEGPARASGGGSGGNPPSQPGAAQARPLRDPIDLSEFSIGGRRETDGPGGYSGSYPGGNPVDQHRAPALTSRQSAGGLTHGAAPGVDRRTAEKFRRGLMPIEATLDLHGHSQATGYQALKSFVQAHHAAGRRCVLIITGKGLKEDWSVGVLRAALPEWLNTAELRKLILAFTYAQPHHGGSGAVYLLLRRNRQQ